MGKRLEIRRQKEENGGGGGGGEEGRQAGRKDSRWEDRLDDLLNIVKFVLIVIFGEAFHHMSRGKMCGHKPFDRILDTLRSVGSRY